MASVVQIDQCLQAILDQPLSTEQLQMRARQRMEVIVSAAANMATSEYTRDLHQDQITTECNAVRVQFHKLLQVFPWGYPLLHDMYLVISCVLLGNTPPRLQWKRHISSRLDWICSRNRYTFIVQP